MKKRFALITAVTIVSGLIVSCTGGKTFDANQPTVQEVRDVAIVKVARSSFEDFYEATGTVKAKTTTHLSSNMMGRIISFPAVEGDIVSRGQILVEIDSSESKAQVQKAQAGLEEVQASLAEVARSVDGANAAVRTAEANKQLAEVTFARYKKLFDRGSASAQEFDEARSKLNSATSEFDRARADVQMIFAKNKQIDARLGQAKAEIARANTYAGYSRILSPVSGIVVKKFVELGATAAPGSPLLAIEDNSQYRLEAGVEESRSKLIHIGTRVSVRIDAIGPFEFTGMVAEILPTSDAASRSYIVKIDVPANALLRTGLYGVARFSIARKEAITLPQTAMVQRGQLTGVYVVGADGTVHFRIVTIGNASEGTVEILSGVSEGDDVASSDVDGLRDGTKVR